MFSETRLGKAIDSERCLPLVDEVAQSVFRNPGALISLARLKTQDDYSYMHSVAVCALMVSLARQLGHDADGCRAAGLAGLLHDLGKIAIPESVLRKTGPLSEEEWAVMRRHPIVGAQIVAPLEFFADGAVIVRHHHERQDGSGYPDGLRGELIPLGARIVAVADVYDAFTSDRPYRPRVARAELTSIATSASVWSITSEPPAGRLTCRA